MIPLSVKLGYSAFMAVLVPFYLATYRPTNDAAIGKHLSEAVKVRNGGRRPPDTGSERR